MKNSADQGGFYHTLGDLQNSSLPTKAEFNIEDITRLREDTNFMFEWLAREHKIHVFELTCNVLFNI